LDKKVDIERPARRAVVPYEVNVTEGQNWVYARVHEPVTKTLALDLLNDAARLAAEHGVSHLLIDARGAPSTKSTVEDYDIAYRRVPQLGFERGSRTAIIVDEADESHHFFETCMMNAGHNWRVFSDADRARRWVASEQPSGDA